MQEEIKQLRELLAAGGDIPPELMAKLGGGGKKTKKKEQKIKRGKRVCAHSSLCDAVNVISTIAVE